MVIIGVVIRRPARCLPILARPSGQQLLLPCNPWRSPDVSPLLPVRVSFWWMGLRAALLMSCSANSVVCSAHAAYLLICSSARLLMMMSIQLASGAGCASLFHTGNNCCSSPGSWFARLQDGALVRPGFSAIASARRGARMARCVAC
jgi:hypothetical protein